MEFDNFTYNIPTKIHFGKGQIEKLGPEVKARASKVLLVFGGGSIKRNGIYDDITNEFKKCGIEWIDFGGVEPNPRIETVRAGVALCKENGIDGVVAAGGGSSIDCSKSIAAGALYDGDPWDFALEKAVPEKALPIFAVVTMAATGSEMDPIAVISNMETNEKLAFEADACIPSVAILDPTYTFSLPASQTAAGIADIMSHTFENYFSLNESSYLADGLAEEILKTCIKCAPVLLEDPENYEARANIMWCAPWAINGFISMGKAVAWSTHPIEHVLSAHYDITHGVGLAIITPAWMRFVLNEKTLPRFVRYGVKVWGIDPDLDDEEIANKAIDLTKEFFDSIGLPSTLSEVGIEESKLRLMAEQAWAPRFEGATFGPLTVDDIYEIFKMCF